MTIEFSTRPISVQEMLKWMEVQRFPTPVPVAEMYAYWTAMLGLMESRLVDPAMLDDLLGLAWRDFQSVLDQHWEAWRRASQLANLEQSMGLGDLPSGDGRPARDSA